MIHTIFRLEIIMDRLLSRRTLFVAFVIVLCIIMVIYGGLGSFIYSAYGLFFVMVLRTIWFFRHRKYKSKISAFSMIITYFALLVLQITYISAFIKVSDISSSMYFILSRWLAIGLLGVDLIFERIALLREYAFYALPTPDNKTTLSFKDILVVYRKIKSIGKVVNMENFEEIVTDLPRHSSLSYVNDGSLADAYFEKAKETLNDPYVYVILSNTGSAASDVISMFTQKMYNHASIAFDKDLETIVSYNGGEKVYPPGLNHEMIEYFNKKEEASIIVYRLPASKEQKQLLIDKVELINRQGSAYNMLGLVFKYSYRPNIMFCSQFVYKMLKSVGLEYFDKKDAMVKPTDLIELDYYRKLEFCYEIYLNEK